jgi:hypothetical protein
VDHTTLLNSSGNARRATAILGRVEPSNSSTRIGYVEPLLPHRHLEANATLEEDSEGSTKEVAQDVLCWPVSLTLKRTGDKKYVNLSNFDNNAKAFSLTVRTNK